MTPDIKLARQGLEIHSEGMPEYTMCKAVIDLHAEVERLTARLAAVEQAEVAPATGDCDNCQYSDLHSWKEPCHSCNVIDGIYSNWQPDIAQPSKEPQA